MRELLLHFCHRSQMQRTLRLWQMRAAPVQAPAQGQRQRRYLFELEMILFRFFLFVLYIHINLFFELLLIRCFFRLFFLCAGPCDRRACYGRWWAARVR